MSERIWGVLILIAAVFPFLMLGFKLLQAESILTAGIFIAIVIIFFVTLILAWRARSSKNAS